MSPDLAAGLLGVAVAVALFRGYIAVSNWFEHKHQEAALKALQGAIETERSCEPAAVGAMLYDALAGIATVDYERNECIRRLTAEVLARARPEA